MKSLYISLALAAATLAAQPPKPVAAHADASQLQSQQFAVMRTTMHNVEKNIDARLGADPYDLVGNTRGVYLPGTGAILTVEVALAKLPGPSPFHQTFTMDEKAKARQKKLDALPKLREALKAALAAAANQLQMVPLNEKIVVGANLFYWNWEDPSGLPSQIVMQATRSQVATHPETIQVQEY